MIPILSSPFVHNSAVRLCANTFGFEQCSLASFGGGTCPLVVFQPSEGDMGIIRDDIPLQATGFDNEGLEIFGTKLFALLCSTLPLLQVISEQYLLWSKDLKVCKHTSLLSLLPLVYS